VLDAFGSVGIRDDEIEPVTVDQLSNFAPKVASLFGVEPDHRVSPEAFGGGAVSATNRGKTGAAAAFARYGRETACARVGRKPDCSETEHGDRRIDCGSSLRLVPPFVTNSSRVAR
jgi:hypothetical protein